MENWSAHDNDRPYLQPEERPSYLAPLAAIAVAALTGVAAYYYLQQERPPRQAASAQLPAAAPAPQASVPAAAPSIQHPIAPTQDASAPPLPPLDESDTLMRESVTGLIGRKAFNDIVIPEQLVRRVVATVDNLSRPTAPRRMIPLARVPGDFATSAIEDEATLHASNFARYTPYVRVLESIEPAPLVRSYVRAYPLFQRAYEELGYGGRYFNDRLIATLDDLLAAPEVEGPIKLVRSKVLYEFADPELEQRSAGQKILLRMGPVNAAQVKAKLRDIRRELVAAGRK